MPSSDEKLKRFLASGNSNDRYEARPRPCRNLKQVYEMEVRLLPSQKTSTINIEPCLYSS